MRAMVYSYLIFELVDGNHVHHYDVVCEGVQSRDAYVAVGKHSPETHTHNTHIINMTNASQSTPKRHRVAQLYQHLCYIL